MNDAGRMRGVECGRDLRRDAKRAAGRHAAHAIDLVGEQRTLEVLEDDERHFVPGEPHIGRLDDVRVADRAGGPCLVHESLDDPRIGGKLGAQDLDRDPALDQHVLGQIDRSHPAFADRLDDLVAPFERIAGFHCDARDSHRRDSIRPRYVVRLSYVSRCVQLTRVRDGQPAAHI